MKMTTELENIKCVQLSKKEPKLKKCRKATQAFFFITRMKNVFENLKKIPKKLKFYVYKLSKRQIVMIEK